MGVLEGVRGAEGERVAELLPVPTVETLALALAEGVADREAVRLPLGGREPVTAAVGTAELLGEAEEEGAAGPAGGAAGGGGAGKR